MTERVYLHVGAPKSGTTYLQRILRHNRERLAEQGVLVAGRTHHELIHAGFVVREDRRLAHLPARAGRAWDRLVAEVAAFPGPTAIISYELFAGARAEQARRAIESLAPCEVHVVITCRDFGRMVSSGWQERLKFGWSTRLEEWRPRSAQAGPTAEWSWRTMNPAEVALRWGSSLPPERVHIVTVPRSSGEPTELWRRFSEACSLTASGLDLDLPRVNESLGPRAAEVLRRVNTLDHGPVTGAREQSRWLRDTLAHAVLAELDDEQMTITPAQLRGARRRAREAVEQIRSEGWRVHGDLGDLDASRREGRTPGAVGTEELLDVSVQAIVSLLLELRSASRGEGVTARPDAPDAPTGDGLRARVRRAGAALRGQPSPQRGALADRVTGLEAQVREDRALHERVAALTDLVNELLLPPTRRDEATMKRALRDYRRESL